MARMNKSRQLLKSIDPRPDESIQSIAMRLAPLALVSPDQFLRYGLDHAAGLASLPTDANAIHRLGELGGFAPAEMVSRGIVRGKLGYIIYKREVPLDWVGCSPAGSRCSEGRWLYAVPPLGLAAERTGLRRAHG
jgi:hypothetical protein